MHGNMNVKYILFFDILKMVDLFGLLSINEWYVWLTDCISNEVCALVTICSMYLRLNLSTTPDLKV